MTVGDIIKFFNQMDKDLSEQPHPSDGSMTAKQVEWKIGEQPDAAHQLTCEHFSGDGVEGHAGQLLPAQAAPLPEISRREPPPARNSERGVGGR
jgi:hypothetical protein